MKSTAKAASLMAGIVLLTAPLLAADGILMIEKTTMGGKTVTNQVQIEKNRMRAEATGPTGGKQIVVFNGATQVMTLIDPDKKTYTELTKAEIEQIGAQMSAAMAQMQEQLKSMPPEQREMVEKMMKGRGASMGMGAPAAKTEYKKAGTDTVGKWTCDKYEGYQNGQKVAEVCTVEPTALGFTLADFDVTKQMAEFFQKLMPQGADRMFSVGSIEAQGYSGVPVKRVTGTGAQQTIIELSEVSRQTFADAVFAVPQGFKKEQMGGMGRGR